MTSSDLMPLQVNEVNYEGLVGDVSSDSRDSSDSLHNTNTEILDRYYTYGTHLAKSFADIFVFRVNIIFEKTLNILTILTIVDNRHVFPGFE